MEDTYYLVGLKQSAWLTTTGQYSTDRTAAAKFSFDDAIARCRRHKEAGNILAPVNTQHMDLV